MKSWKLALGVIVLAVAVSGCKGKEKAKEVSGSNRAQAEQNFSEAEFAIQIRDHARAEALLARAVELVPEDPNYWLHLGGARKRLGEIEGARKAYKKAQDLVHAAYERDKTAPDPLFAEMEILILLGKPEDARRVYDQAARDHKDDPGMKRFVENRMFDTLLTAPGLKELAL